MKKVKVFPLPYAGASVSVYYRWKSLLPDNYELIMLELAGRGSRLGENFYQTVDEASEDIASKIKNVISGDDYILFGHSMGALLAYEVYFRLLEKQVKPAIHVIFSGQNTPYAINSIDGIENLNDSDFISMVEQYGGLPESFYDKEVRGFFLPILKADFYMTNKYIYRSRLNKISCDVSVLSGENDRTVSRDNLTEWNKVTDKKVHFYSFRGGHFFCE